MRIIEKKCADNQWIVGKLALQWSIPLQEPRLGGLWRPVESIEI